MHVATDNGPAPKPDGFDVITARRVAMVANGYRPITVKGKNPFIKGWQNTVATEQMVRAWERERSDYRNTGVLTALTPAIDIDILAEDVADKIEALVRQRFGGKGQLPRRVGKAPKRAFLFRTDAPFKKLKLSLCAPGEPTPTKLDECTNGIEILGDGQQIVVAGIHPDTQRPYTWTDGEPWTVERDALPVLTQAEAQEFMDDAEKLFREHGWFIWEEKPEPEVKPAPDSTSTRSHGLSLIMELAIKLWGKPTPEGHEYKFCGREKTVDPIRMLWWDFANDTGGGIRELMKLVQGRNNEPKQGQAIGPLLQTSGQFVKDHVPPDYLIDALLQQDCVYSLTGPTGGGKTSVALRLAMHVALGLDLHDKDVVKGRVLIFAGENPNEVRSRWIKLCEDMDQDPDVLEVFFLPGSPNIGAPEIRAQIDKEAAQHGPFNLLIIDTNSAYFVGDDENNNAQVGAHARMLRSFTKLPGKPTVLVTCHPTKAADMNNLLPRGGGSFLAEVDGNLVAIKPSGSMIVEINTHGKFRGPDFQPFAFKLKPATSEKLKDSRGRLVWTVTAEPITETEKATLDATSQVRANELLCEMKRQENQSLTQLAEALNWKNFKDEPNKRLVQKIMDTLAKDKLVELNRSGHYVLTPKGKLAAAAAAAGTVF